MSRELFATSLHAGARPAGRALDRSAPLSLGWIALALAISSASDVRVEASPISVLSPDRAVEFKVLADNTNVALEVFFHRRLVIETSPLVFSVDGVNLMNGVEPGDVKRYELQESYPWRGGHARAANHYNGAILPLRHAGSRTQHTLEIRAFNNGVAFRHLLTAGDRPRVPDEATTLILPGGSTIWHHDLEGHYEDVHVKSDVSALKAGEWCAPPLTFKLPGAAGYGSITEAALVNYSGMALRADGRRGFEVVLGHKHPPSYPFRLRYSNDVERVAKPAPIAGAITSPWRVVMLGADLNALVNSDIVHNLAPPADPKLFPKGMETDWIKPGRAVWKYLDGGQNSFEQMKDFSRWAGELGFEYQVIEGFWSRWSDEQVQELVEYSRQRGVGLFFWRHSRELRTPAAREEFFARLSRLGVAGAKIDFFDHEHKDVIDLYAALLESAAKHRILVNFHGANKPTGEPRTWPNELTREGVRGMESSRLRERARHNTTLPFTRYLAGHGDYTPVHFGPRRGDTTWTHQIATAAIFDEPLLTYAAHPTNLLNNPAIEMIKSIPAVWDETRVLSISEIGELAAFARRTSRSWFLAILNGPEARTLNVPLTFLGADEYRALLVRDDRDARDNAAALRVESASMKGGDMLTVELTGGGGFIARFEAK
jgi:alpha-glucosidase